MATLLDQDIQHLTLLVHGPPHEHARSFDAHQHFVQMPDAICPPTTPSDTGCERWTELVHPAVDRFITYQMPSFRKHIFDITQARGEAIIEPYREPDHVRSEPMALEGNGFHTGLPMQQNAASGDRLALDWQHPAKYKTVRIELTAL
jgi:hypothetical protein